jgi:hypothetical protein
MPEVRDSAPTLDERTGNPRAERAENGSGDAERYKRGTEIARGGMGRVVEADDAVLGRTVAVKESLAVDGETAARFEREVMITARLEHPSIVPVYDAGRDAAGVPFYVMRKVSGQPLDKLIVDAKGLDGRLTLLPHFLAVLDALGHAHRRGIVHRDLKPNNVLVGDLGETVVIDWGLAKVIGEDAATKPGTGTGTGTGTGVGSGEMATIAGVVVGTPGFMSPEQAVAGEIDARSDVFALGATLYHLLGGVPPFHGSSATEILDRTVMDAPRPLGSLAPGVPPDLVTIVDKAMARDPDARYPDAAAMGEDLRRFLAGQLVASHHYSRRQRLARFVRKNRVALAIVAIAAIVVVAVAALSLRRILADRDRIAGEQARAEAALADANDKAESLLVDKARAVVEQDPSHALGLLRELPPTSQRWSIDAHAVASAARQRGVRFALPGHPGSTNVLALSPDGNQLLSHGSDHALLLHDLERRTTRELIPSQRAPMWAVWAGSSIVILDVDKHDTLRIVDLAARRDRTIDAHAVQQVTGSRTGWLAWKTHDGALRVARASDDTSIELAIDKSIGFSGITVDDDATLLIAHGEVATQVFRRTGDTWRAFARIDQPSITGRIAPDLQHVALIAYELVTEWRLDDKPVQTGRWVDKWITALYAGDRESLYGVDAFAALEPLHGDDVRSTPRVAAMATPLADGLVASGDSDVLRIVGNGFELRLPTGGHIARTASRPGGRFLIGATQSLIFVWDIDEALPDRITQHHLDLILTTASFTVVGSQTGDFVEFIDRDNKATRYRMQPPPFAFAADDADDIAWPTIDGVTKMAIDGTLKSTPFPGAKVTVPRPDGGILVGMNDGRIVSLPPDGGGHRPKVLAKVGAPVVRFASHAGHIAMFTDQGSIWRSTDNAVLPGFDTIEDAWIARDGTIYLSRQSQILRWNVGSSDVFHVADLPHAIAAIRGLRDTGKLAVMTRDNAVFTVAPETAHVDAVAGPGPVGTISRDGRIVARMSPARIEVVDLVQRSEWTIPAVGAQYTRVAITVDGGHLLADDEYAGVVRWDLGLETIDDAAPWVAKRTNARVGTRRELVWDLTPITDGHLPEPAR